MGVGVNKPSSIGFAIYFERSEARPIRNQVAKILRVETSLGFMNLYSTLFNMAAVFISIEYVAPTFNMATEYHESLMNIAAMLNTEYMERIFIQAPC